jgi:hypothetical protein
MIHFGDDVARFVSEQLGFGLCPPFVGLGLKRNGKIVAGIIINHFEGADCHVTAAGKGWTRAFLRAVGSYVYDQLGCERMTFVTEQQEVVALALRLGGVIEGCMRSHFGPGRDGIVIGVLRDEWRWGKVRASAQLDTTLRA